MASDACEETTAKILDTVTILCRLEGIEKVTDDKSDNLNYGTLHLIRTAHQFYHIRVLENGYWELSAFEPNMVRTAPRRTEAKKWCTISGSEGVEQQPQERMVAHGQMETYRDCALHLAVDLYKNRLQKRFKNMVKDNKP